MTTPPPRADTRPFRPDDLDHLVTTTHLLVATDFDGTLAPIVDDPAAARAHPQAGDALAAVAALSNTTLAVLSGRSFGFLSEIEGIPAGARLAGSHGAEFGKPGIGTSEEREASLRSARAEVDALAAQFDGSEVEHKPASVAFHYRHLSGDRADVAKAALIAGPGGLPGISVQHGKKVVELSIATDNKGTAISRLRDETGASAVLYLGDDTTDEDAFAVLDDGDLGVKVGPGPTAAGVRVESVDEVVLLITELARRRATLR